MLKQLELLGILNVKTLAIEGFFFGMLKQLQLLLILNVKTLDIEVYD